MKLFLVVAAVLAVSSCASISLEDMEFHAWKLKFEKSYDSPSEETQRKQIWLSNRKLVLKHNALADQGLKSYRLGMTYFADMENEEYKQLVSQSYLDTFNDSLPRHGSTFNRLPEGTVLPNTVDWRHKGYVTKVKDQKHCGACWAFSAAGALEGQHFKKTGKLVSLSEQQLVDCSSKFGNHGCKGGHRNKAFEYIRKAKGIQTEASYHYKAKIFLDIKVGAAAQLIQKKKERVLLPNFEQISNIRKLLRRDNVVTTLILLVRHAMVDVSPNEAALKEAVATIGPITASIDASHDSFRFYKSGVYDEPQCSKSELGHAVLVVGYGNKRGHDYWLVKNSWGLKWGDKGYIKMTRNKSNQCGIATRPSYPLV